MHKENANKLNALVLASFFLALVFVFSLAHKKSLAAAQGEAGENTDTALLYAELPDPDFPVPLDSQGQPIPYTSMALPEEGYEVTGYWYPFSETVLKSYQLQLQAAGFTDLGSAGAVQSLWRYDRERDGLTLMLEMNYDQEWLAIAMYVNALR